MKLDPDKEVSAAHIGMLHSRLDIVLWSDNARKSSYWQSSYGAQNIEVISLNNQLHGTQPDLSRYSD